MFWFCPQLLLGNVNVVVDGYRRDCLVANRGLPTRWLPVPVPLHSTLGKLSSTTCSSGLDQILVDRNWKELVMYSFALLLVLVS